MRTLGRVSSPVAQMAMVVPWRPSLLCFGRRRHPCLRCWWGHREHSPESWHARVSAGCGWLEHSPRSRKCTFNSGGGCRRARKLNQPLQIIMRRLNDPHNVIMIGNAQHVVDKTWTHWGEGNIRKRAPVIHHRVCDVQALKTTRPNVFLKSQGLVRAVDNIRNGVKNVTRVQQNRFFFAVNVCNFGFAAKHVNYKNQSGGQNQKWPTSGPGGYITLPPRGSPTLQSGGQNQKWPTSGPGGYITLPPRGSPTLQSGGQNQKWPAGGHIAYMHAFSVELVFFSFAVRSGIFFFGGKRVQKNCHVV